MKRFLLALSLLLVIFSSSAEVIHIIYVSDTHYGITREFRGREGVSSQDVNRVLISKLNELPSMTLPKKDGAVASGEKIGYIEALINTGDITNRMEKGVLSAKESWAQFDNDWSTLLNLKNKRGEMIPQYLSAGNHEASNAVGLYKLTMPTDVMPMVEIYNRMMNPTEPLSVENYDFRRDKIHYSMVIGGVRFLFVALWLDSEEIEWSREELRRVGGNEPVLLFSHDAPVGEPKHFISPNSGNLTTTAVVDKFENILCDTASVRSVKEAVVAEQMALSRFIRSEPRIKGFFHGDDNHSEFYDYIDPEGNNVIPTFRVDSPMKGNISKRDESRLSFMLLSLDTQSLELTARECLWNKERGVEWGECRTISLK